MAAVELRRVMTTRSEKTFQEAVAFERSLRALMLRDAAIIRARVAVQENKIAPKDCEPITPHQQGEASTLDDNIFTTGFCR